MASESDRPGKIMVAGIPMSETFTEADLEKEFAPFGRITEVLIVTDKRKGKPRGFAFVTYENPKDAQDAMKAMTGKDIGGNKPLRCEQAKIAEHNRQENVMDDSRGRGRGRGFRGGENMTRGRGGFRGDERGRGRFRGDYRGRGGFRHDDRGRGGFRGDDRGRGGFRGDDRGRGGFRGDDRGRGGFRGDDFGRGGGFRVGLLDRGRGRRVGREEYHEEEYRGDEFQEHHFEDVRRPPLQRLPIGGVRGVPGRKTLLPPPSWSGPGRGGQNDGVEEYYNEEGNDWYSGEGNTRAYRDGQEESYGAEYNDDYYEQDDYQDSYEESRSVRGGGRGRASLRHPGRGGMEPPRRGGMGPLRREELESPRRGEIDSILGRGDMGPPRRGNAGPLRRGEMEPARRGEMESVRRGEMEPRRRGDMEPLRRGEVEPPRRSVPTPSRRIHEYGEDESVDAAHRRPARYDERYLGMRGENGGREQGDWAAQEREGQSDYAYHREEEDYWEEGQGDESYRLPPGKMTGRGGLEMGGPRRKPLLEAEHRLGASNEGYEEGDYSGPLPYGRRPPAHPEERYREDGSEGGMMTGGRGVRRPPPGDGGRYDDDRYPGEPNIDPSRRDGYREERRAPLMKRPNESYPPHRRSDEMYPGPQSNRDYDYDPQSRKRPMDDDNFRMSNDIVALRRQYENILERTGGGPPIVKRERFDGYQGHP